MMQVRAVILAFALVMAAFAGFMLARVVLKNRARAKNREEAMRRSGVTQADAMSAFASDDIAAKTLQYLLTLNRKLAHGATKPLTTWMPAPSLAACRAFEETALRSGFKGEIAFEAVREARVRLGALAAMVGFVLGACISNELMAVLAIAGFVLGAFLPGWSLRQEIAARDARLKSELPEMLEVVSLGISSGLSFDRSFGLYPAYFETPFARDCGEALRKWSLGLASRDDALQDLARGYDSALLSRVVQNIVRSMRFGTRLSDDLERAAADSRAEQKAARQEMVAKVPVRMMIPTACLILPAMLLLVLGPVLLELIEGF